MIREIVIGVDVKDEKEYDLVIQNLTEYTEKVSGCGNAGCWVEDAEETIPYKIRVTGICEQHKGRFDCPICRQEFSYDEKHEHHLRETTTGKRIDLIVN